MSGAVREGKAGKREKGRTVRRILILLLFLGAVGAFVCFFPVEITGTEGTELTDPETVTTLLFPEKNRTLLRLALRSFRKAGVPGITSWKLKKISLSEYVLVVREEEPVAVIRSEGRYLLLGQSGAVLKVSGVLPEGVPLIIGCGMTGGEALTVPEVQDREAYEELLIYGRAVRNMGIEIVSLQYADGGVFLHFTDITVSLGDAGNAEAKLRVVREQMGVFEGLSGTLHLENYDPESSAERYVFEMEVPDPK